MNVNENRQIAEAQADGEAADDRRRLAMAIDPDKLSCGCDFPRGGGDWCDFKLEPFAATRAQLRGLNKRSLFVLEMFLDGADSVELTPFI